MQIGDRYADSKLYRGIEHYNNLPLTSRDLHEAEDTLYNKSRLLTNNLIGSGIINKPNLAISSTGVSLLEPAVLLLDGDIVLIQSDSEILKLSEVERVHTPSGYLCVVGWYQRLDSKSTLRNYGGVDNSSLPFDENGYNEIIDPDLKYQVSSRYQFRWDTALVSSHYIDMQDSLPISNLYVRDADGASTGENFSTTATLRGDGIYTAPKSDHLEYAVSDVYVIPLLKYSYSNSVFTEVTPIKPIKISSPYSIRKYQSKVVVSENSRNSVDTYKIGIDYGENDILKVMYEGLTLIEGEHYTVNSARDSITLLGVTIEAGANIIFEVNKLVEDD